MQLDFKLWDDIFKVTGLDFSKSVTLFQPIKRSQVSFSQCLPPKLLFSANRKSWYCHRATWGLLQLRAFSVRWLLVEKLSPGKFPNLLFPIEVQNIVKSKHTSNTGVYDAEGNFDPAKFEEIFHKNSKANVNALTADELSGMLKSNRVPKDYSGQVGSWVEWKTLFSVCKETRMGYCRRKLFGHFTLVVFSS
ncbi:hypothetical protein MKW94_011016 [Papaver nudicaule]|uniref:Uncharacterized protein n=1 Tax=Papaver nudicaule TaxID=74823 RepID=A0AA41S1M0_PAPNU|nr:hypothetical protein [Papaver nudicaule]